MRYDKKPKRVGKLKIPFSKFGFNNLVILPIFTKKLANKRGLCLLKLDATEREISFILVQCDRPHRG